MGFCHRTGSDLLLFVLFRVSELGLDFINYTSLGIFFETVFGKPGYTVTVGSF